MHAQQETWFGDAVDDREDPTLVWTGSRAPVEPPDPVPPTSSPIAALVAWSVIAALALLGALAIMRVLVLAAPMPRSSARALPAKSVAIAITTSSTPAPAPAIDGESAREVEPTRESVARVHSRRAQLKKAMHAGVPGTLRINSLPWAEVYLDGTHVGPTPQSKLSLKPGRHRVKLVNEPMALRKSFDVYVRPGQVITRSENLSL